MRVARIALLIALVVPASALAQQPAQTQMTPSQVAIAITTSVNQLAQAVEQLARENEELKKQLKGSVVVPPAGEAPRQ
jgi:hypothetical protein